MEASLPGVGDTFGSLGSGAWEGSRFGGIYGIAVVIIVRAVLAVAGVLVDRLQQLGGRRKVLRATVVDPGQPVRSRCVAGEKVLVRLLLLLLLLVLLVLLLLLGMLLLLLRIATHAAQPTDIGQMLQIMDDLLEGHSDRQDAGRWHRTEQLSVHPVPRSTHARVTASSTATAPNARHVSVRTSAVGEDLDTIVAFGVRNGTGVLPDGLAFKAVDSKTWHGTPSAPGFIVLCASPMRR
uniref:Uncharacterized protein n=1 Tax=Anopheles atroparvus TaxID=41427 RepID=A0A182IYT3_ANOAO